MKGNRRSYLSQKQKQSKETDLRMTQVLESAAKDFKATL